MSGRAPKVSGKYFTFLSTGSYVIGIEDDDILIGEEALDKVLNYISKKFVAKCDKCGRLVSINSIGLLKIIDGRVRTILCRDCV
ncbi:MAG: hypothetical protein GXO26_00380, partial [Crenarchaeota archaeon]|nr:hypothetical protein [Thermoproteota archaeon]